MIADLELWVSYRRSRDSGLRDRLVEKYLVLVKHAAARIASRLPSHIRMDDLFSAGLLGFLRAIEDYDPERGVEFAAYASSRIRGAIVDELRRLDWVPRGVRRKLREAGQAVESLSQSLDRPPTDAEVAGAIGIDVERYQRMLGDGGTLVSLDASPTQEDGLPRIDSMDDPDTPSPFLLLEAKERRALLARMIERLPKKEQQVVALYYGEELTMQEIGRALGVSESRVSQLHSSAVLRLRAALRRARVDAGDVELSSPTLPGRARRPW
jgi:RNA polymerase sigma factor for flagellar operon FliA